MPINRITGVKLVGEHQILSKYAAQFINLQRLCLIVVIFLERKG